MTLRQQVGGGKFGLMSDSPAAAVEHDDAWVDEIDFDPDGAWLRMGTRNLGSRPWLVVDGKRQAELALKRQLLSQRFDEVFVASDDAESASAEALSLISGALSALALSEPGSPTEGSHGPRSLHPLDEAGRMIQEDLCLLRPVGNGSWVLAAASLCFPSRWRLAAKIGRGLNAVHSPVSGYEQSLTTRVDSLMTRLATRVSVDGPESDGRVVWRRNWFIHPDPSLFQPDRPDTEPTIGADDCLDELHLRSERQTLRALPRSGWVLFTIRTQQTSLRTVISTDTRRSAFVNHVHHGSPDLLEHRGVDAAQREQLLAALV